MIPPILRLPDELLICIMDCLTVYVDDGLQAWVPHGNSLLNLALTCTALRELSLDRLYHHPATVGAAKPISGLYSLVLTLCKNMHRAKQVRELTLIWPDYKGERSPLAKPGEDPSLEFDDMLHQACREHDILCRTMFDGDGQQNAALDYDNHFFPYRFYGSYGSWDALASLAVVKSPNLQRLEMTAGGDNSALTVRKPGLLPSLTKVRWLPVAPTRFWYQDGGLDWQVAAAPALRRLTLRNMAGLRDMAPCPVTDLVLDRAVLDVAGVGALQRAFPGLQRLALKLVVKLEARVETFRVPRGYRLSTVATCAFVVDALARTYGESLRRLRLDWCGGIRDHPAASCSLTRLRAMTALTELTLVRPQDHHDYSPCDEKPFWAGLLPPNLEVLTVVNAEDCWDPAPLLSAVEEQCGKMREVIVRKEYDSHDMSASSPDSRPRTHTSLITHHFSLSERPGQACL